MMLKMREEMGRNSRRFSEPFNDSSAVAMRGASLDLFSHGFSSAMKHHHTVPHRGVGTPMRNVSNSALIPVFYCNQTETPPGMFKSHDSLMSAFASSNNSFLESYTDKCYMNQRARPESDYRKEHGIMEEGSQQDAAINLSTGREVKELAGGTAVVSVATAINGDVRNGDSHNHETSQVSSLPQIPTPNKNSNLVGAAKRKLKSVSDTSSAVQQASQQSQQPLLMMAAQHGLSPQQVQQLLQQQGVSPQQLQQMMQQQTLMLQHQQQQQQQQKLHEGMLHQLNEQLQLNVLQQSQLIQQQQQEKPKSGKHAQQQLQQLAIQQQQLIQQIQQIQLQQRQYLLACLVQPFGGMPQGMMSPAEIQQLWKEVAAQSGLEESSAKNGLSIPTIPIATSASNVSAPLQAPVIQAPNYLSNGGIPVDGFLIPGITPLSQAVPCSNRHNDSAKPSSGSEASNGSSPPSNPLFRHNVCKWPGCDTPCEDYHSFTKHLNSEHILDDRSTAQARVQMQVVSQLEIQLSREKEMLQAMMQHLHMKPPQRQHSPPPTPSQPSQPPPPPQLIPKQEVKPEPITLNTPTIIPKHSPLSLTTTTPHQTVTMVTSPLVAMTPTLTPSSPLPPLSQTSITPQSTPPGAGTIRRRVSDKCNLPISAEIQRNREFYKNTDVRPPFTYASLIRQGIIESPNRQLTLNEIYQWFQNTFAYFRRNEATWKNAVRHNLSLHKCFMRVENVKGAVWTVDEVEFYKRRPQKLTGGMKSPSLSDPSSYNETLNASLRAALGEASISLLTAAHNQMTGQESAEDLSMKSLSNSRDGYTSPGREEELMMLVKQEVSREAEEGSTERQEDPVVEEEGAVETFFQGDERATAADDMDQVCTDDNQALVMADVEEDKMGPEEMSMEEQSELQAPGQEEEKVPVSSMVMEADVPLENGNDLGEADADLNENPEMLALRRMQQEANKMVAANSLHSTD